MDHDQVLQRLVAWARANENVRAVVLTGSAARGPRYVHPLSDRDVEIYADVPQQLLEDESWFTGLGEVLVVERLPNPGWHPTRLVYYVGGKVDFTIAPTDALRTVTYGSPFRVLLDKDGLARGLTVSPPAGVLPEQDELEECVSWAYAAALMCAKAVVRQELWMAKVRDQDLKAQLLRMIEWDHRARHGAVYDTYHLGLLMHSWMDADVREALHGCWGRFDAADTTRALDASVALFARLAERTARRLSLAPFAHARVQAEIDRILGRDNSAEG